MLPSYVNRMATSPRFKMLVGHNLRPSDPSKGEAGNPIPIRQAFETQVITTHLGNAVLGIATPNQTGIRIVVSSVDFGNVNLGGATKYDYDEIQVQAAGMFDQDRVPALQVGNHLARLIGGGAGNVNDVASELALLLNESGMGLKASVDPLNLNEVICTALGTTDSIFVKVLSFSWDLLAGNPPFIIQDLDGNVLYDPATATNTGAVALVISPKNTSPMISS